MKTFFPQDLSGSHGLPLNGGSPIQRVKDDKKPLISLLCVSIIIIIKLVGSLIEA